MKITKKLMSSVLLVSLSGVVSANGGFYVGGGLGKPSTDEEGGKVSGKAYLGYKVNDLISIEGAYHRLKAMERTVQQKRSYPKKDVEGNNITDDKGNNIIVTDTYDVPIEASDTGLSISVLANYNVGEKVSMFGRVGMVMVDSEVKFSPPLANAEVKAGHQNDHTELLLGVGADMKVSPNLAIRGEIERIGGDDDYNVYTIGAQFTSY